MEEKGGRVVVMEGRGGAGGWGAPPALGCWLVAWPVVPPDDEPELEVEDEVADPPACPVPEVETKELV